MTPVDGVSYKRLCAVCRTHFAGPLQPGWTVTTDARWRCPLCTEKETGRRPRRPDVIR